MSADQHHSSSGNEGLSDLLYQSQVDPGKAGQRARVTVSATQREWRSPPVSRLEWQTSRGLVYSDVPLGPTLVSGMLPYPYAAATLRQLGACLVLLNAMLSLPFRFPAIPFL